jgi:hypothetical protein
MGSVGFGFVVKWRHHRMRRKLLLIICKEKYSILNSGSFSQKLWRCDICVVPNEIK